VQQATTYGYDYAGPYIDIACDKVPVLQSVVKRLVPYAKPSIQLADNIVEKALDLVSKPMALVQGTASSVGEKVVDCKAVIATKAVDYKAVIVTKAVDCKAVLVAKSSHISGIASNRATQCKALACDTLEKYKSLVVERRASLVEMLQEHKLALATKFENASSWASSKLQALAARLRLMELKDMACSKASAGKNSVTAAFETVPSKAYSCASRVVGNAYVDRALEMVAKYAPAMKIAANKPKAGSKQEECKKSK